MFQTIKLYMQIKYTSFPYQLYNEPVLKRQKKCRLSRQTRLNQINYLNTKKFHLLVRWENQKKTDDSIERECPDDKQRLKVAEKRTVGRLQGPKGTLAGSEQENGPSSLKWLGNGPCQQLVSLEVDPEPQMANPHDSPISALWDPEQRLLPFCVIQSCEYKIKQGSNRHL